MPDVLLDVLLSDILYDDVFNCRGPISPMDVADLAKDISRDGLLQPILLSNNPAGSSHKYKLLAGHRRYRAHQVLKRERIRSVVREGSISDVDARILNLKENVNRKQLNVYQEAMALKPLLDLDLTEAAIADRLGSSRGWVQVRCLLLRLPIEFQQEAAAGWLTQSAIRDIYSHFKAHGVDAAREVTKKFKDAKIKGTPNFRMKANKPIVKKDLNVKKHRERPEIEQMQDYFFDQMGKATIANRVLA